MIEAKCFSPGCSILWHMWWQRHTSHPRLKGSCNTPFLPLGFLFFPEQALSPLLMPPNAFFCANSFNLFSRIFLALNTFHFNSLHFEALQRSMHSEGRKPGSLKRKALQFPEEQQKRPAKCAKQFAWRHLRVHLRATNDGQMRSETVAQLSPDYHPSWRSESNEASLGGLAYAVALSKQMSNAGNRRHQYRINTNNSETHPINKTATALSSSSDPVATNSAVASSLALQVASESSPSCPFLLNRLLVQVRFQHRHK